MNTESAAYVYAQALSEVEGNDLKEEEQALLSVLSLFKKNSELQNFYESPKVPAEKKKKAIQAALKSQVSPSVLHMMLLLVDKGRTLLFEDLCYAFSEIVDVHFTRIRPIITLGRDLSESDQKEIVAKIQKLVESKGKDFGVKVVKSMEFLPVVHVNKELLGGVIMRIGDYQWDASVKKYLHEWKFNVLSRKVDDKALGSLSN